MDRRFVDPPGGDFAVIGPGSPLRTALHQVGVFPHLKAEKNLFSSRDTDFSGVPSNPSKKGTPKC
jgi:hypothetical protein